MKNFLKNTRNEDLRTVWNRLVKSGINLSMLSRSAVVKIISESPAPRFYITEKMAERYVYSYLRGNSPVLTSTKKRMVNDLCEVYTSILSADPNKPRWMVWIEVVNHPAKEFYVGRQTIENALFRKGQTLNKSDNKQLQQNNNLEYGY